MKLPALLVGMVITDGATIQKPFSTSNSSAFSEMLSQAQLKNATSTQPQLRSGQTRSSVPAESALSATNPSLPQSGVTRAHFQFGGAQTSDADEKINERALALREYRQVLLASNIANADTPGYHARDIDVQEALRTGKTVTTVEVKYAIPSQRSVDGNTVDMDSERAKFAENAILYEISVNQVRGHYKDMEDLLKNTPY